MKNANHAANGTGKLDRLGLDESLEQYANRTRSPCTRNLGAPTFDFSTRPFYKHRAHCDFVEAYKRWRQYATDLGFIHA